MPEWLSKLLPILILLSAIVIVLRQLPRPELGHSESFRRRRLLNWVPLGLTYAFLYFGRYNLGAINDLLEKDGILTKQQFGDIDGIGFIVYGVAFLLNGPLTDRFGGRITIIIAAAGSAVMNLCMAGAMYMATSGQWETSQLVSTLMVLNGINMYFQSFGAVSIVKVNAGWFHVRERGVLGGMFGILISLGIYFAYDWTPHIARGLGYVATFWVPAVILLGCVVVAYLVIHDRPSGAGHADFDTGDASSGQTTALPVLQVITRMLSQRVILIIIAIEFCSGFLRQAVMKWFRPFAKGVGETETFVYENWGLLLCVAGILGGVFAGFISDHVFGSRRGPVASVLYAGLTAGAALALGVIGGPALGWTVIFMSLCVIGVHGMLSGTASADFGGAKNAGLAVGIIDGFVYLGSATQSLLYGRILPAGAEAKVVDNWFRWPAAMIPVALIGLLLCTRVWNARPKANAFH